MKIEIKTDLDSYEDLMKLRDELVSAKGVLKVKALKIEKVTQTVLQEFFGCKPKYILTLE